VPQQQPEWGRAPSGLGLEFFPTTSQRPGDSQETVSPLLHDSEVTVLGKTRAQWDERLTRTHGPTYVQENQGHLDAQWGYILTL